MSIVIEDPQIEGLVRRIAAAEGVSVEKVLRESLMTLARRRGIDSGQDRTLRERLTELAREVDALPKSTDSRTDTQIIGYDEQGIW